MVQVEVWSKAHHPDQWIKRCTHLFGCCSNSNAREAGVDGSGAVAAVNATGGTDALFANLTDVVDIVAAFSVTQAKETTAGTLASVTGADAANGTSVTGLYGTITIGTDGSYSYVVDNSNSIDQALDETDTLNEAFTVECLMEQVEVWSKASPSRSMDQTMHPPLRVLLNSNAREAGVDGSGAVAAVVYRQR